MMFTHGKHLDVAYNHHLVVVFVEYGVVQHVYTVQYNIVSTDAQTLKLKLRKTIVKVE